jgi:hypothetical protein
MDPKILIEKLTASVRNVPAHANVLALRQRPLDEMEQRTKRFLATLGEAFKLPMQEGEWVPRHDRTLIRMSVGANAVLHHNSGALSVQTGLQPMESLFPDVGTPQSLTRMVEDVLVQTKLRDWISPGTSLKFERLWQIKAAATGREGKTLKRVKPLLCRAVGAYRHFVEELPVWGSPAVALKIAGGGQLDALHVHVRETSGEVIDRPAILRPEEAARRIALQLAVLMGKSKINLDEAAKPEWLRFGFLSLSKRKAQRLLAPTYIAAIHIEGQQEAQAYMFAVPATEVAYLSLPLFGHEAPPSRQRSAVAVPVAAKGKTAA